MKLSTRKTLCGYLFITPNLLLILAFTFIPTILALMLAFKDFKPELGIIGSPWNGFKNFVYIFDNYDFRISVVNTMLYTAVFVPINIILSFLLAALIFPLSPKAKIFFKSAFYLPTVVSAVILAITWKWIFNIDYGIINVLLQKFGYEPVYWFSNRWTALLALVISQLPYAPGVGIILYLAAMSRVPEELISAARIDGANTWRSHYYIILPLLKPTTLYLVVINTIESFKIFTPIYVMSEARPANQSTVVVYEIFKQAFRNGEYGMASAESLILLFILIVFSLIQFKWLSSEAEY